MNKLKNIDVKTLDLLPVAVVVFDHEKIHFLNKKALHVFKVPSKWTINEQKLSILQFIDKKQHHRYKTRVEAILKGKKTEPIEITTLNFKKETIKLEENSNAIYFQNKKAIQAVFTEKIIDPKQSNELEAAKNLLINISKNPGEIIYEYALYPKQHIKYISNSIYKILGIKPEEARKNPNVFIEQIHEDDKEKYIKTLVWYLKNRITTKNNNSIYRFYHKNGKLVYLDAAGTVVRDAKKKIIGLVGVIRDVTEQSTQQQQLEQKWNNYKNVLETAPIGIFIHDGGKCLFCNKAAVTILEAKNEKEIIGTDLKKHIIPQQRQLAEKRMIKAYNGDKLSYLLYKIKTKKNNIVDVELKTTPFIYNGKKCVQTIIKNLSTEKKLTNETNRAEIAEELNKQLLNEIAHRRKIERDLVNQTTKYQALFNNTSHLIWFVDKEFRITSFNENYYHYIKKIFEFELSIGQKVTDVKTKDSENNNNNFWIKKYEAIFNGKNKKRVDFFEIENTDSRGKTHCREIYLHPIKNEKNLIDEIAIIAHDVTERKISEQKIREQSAKLQAIFNSGDQLMWTVGANKQLTSFNKNYQKAFLELNGIYPEIGKSLEKTTIRESYDFWNDKYDLAFSGKQIEFITEKMNAEGSNTIRQVILYPIKNNSNKVIEVSAIAFDITENKKNEERITQSLQEKEVLLKEIHHRVKNNLQVISSILNLQSSYVKDDYAINLLKECQNRIKSMAFIHESLYQTKNFEAVDFSEYITTLSKNLIQTYAVSSKKIKLLLTLDKLALSLDASISCGLIINEIISNSLKYAFPNHRDGIIFVILKHKHHKVRIEAGDNGVGIPKQMNIKETETLGLQLVDALIEQLNGKLTLDRTNGTRFIIEFNT